MPKLNFKGHADNKRVRREETSAPFLFGYKNTRVFVKFVLCICIVIF